MSDFQVFHYPEEARLAASWAVGVAWDVGNEECGSDQSRVHVQWMAARSQNGNSGGVPFGRMVARRNYSRGMSEGERVLVQWRDF